MSRGPASSSLSSTSREGGPGSGQGSEWPHALGPVLAARVPSHAARGGGRAEAQGLPGGHPAVEDSVCLEVGILLTLSISLTLAPQSAASTCGHSEQGGQMQTFYSKRNPCSL